MDSKRSVRRVGPVIVAVVVGISGAAASGCGPFLKKFVRPPVRRVKPVQVTAAAPELATPASRYGEAFRVWHVRQDALWAAVDGSSERRRTATARMREALVLVEAAVPVDRRGAFAQVRADYEDALDVLTVRRMLRADRGAARHALRVLEHGMRTTWAPELVEAAPGEAAPALAATTPEE